MNCLNSPEPPAIVNVARAIVDQPQDDGDYKGSKQAGLYAPQYGELVADVMVFEPRQHPAMLWRHSNNDFRFGLFVSAKQPYENERDKNKRHQKQRNQAYRKEKGQDAERKRTAMKKVSYFPTERVAAGGVSVNAPDCRAELTTVTSSSRILCRLFFATGCAFR